MIKVKLATIMVSNQDRARAFYTEKLGFKIKHDIPLGGANWLTLVSPDEPNGVELLLEPITVKEAVNTQNQLYVGNIPITQLHTDNIQREYETLRGRGVVFRDAPKPMGPTFFADFDDTCGNFIRLIQG
jgi:catechol 2,3-dioxygenase-like lactoylglutathione lyase family enzyme